MRNVMRVAGVIVAVLVPAAVARAQATPARPAAPAPAAAAPQPAPQTTPSAPEVYSYDPEGRRDPFVSLTTRGDEMRPQAQAGTEGIEGMPIEEITVRGIVRSRNAFIAMVLGPDKKSYIIHTGDKMLDGTVKAITADAVVFAQDVNDPLSMIKQREVRKTLRVPEEGK